MKLISFIKGGQPGYGILDGDSITDLGKRLGAECPDLKSLLASAEGLPELEHQHGNVDLMARAGKALMRWAAAGFTNADEATYARRMAACEHCPELTDAPDQAVYRLQFGDEPRICRLCGCLVQTKASLLSETCPGEDPTTPGRNRWGERLAPVAS